MPDREITTTTAETRHGSLPYRPARTSRAQHEDNRVTPADYRQKDPWLALAGTVALGGISGAAYYLGFVRPYLLGEYYRQPLLDLAKINGVTATAANSWALSWVVLFACYFLAFRFCPQVSGASKGFRRAALAVICGWAAYFSISLIFMYPTGAADLFDQIFRARLLAHYGLNPFTTIPGSEALQADPFLKYVAWTGDPSPYGPVWELLAGGTSLLAGENLWRNLILFKLLVVVAYGLNVALTYGIMREIRPAWALKGTLFFAWNPLMLFEVAGNGHNDSIVATFLLLGVYLFVRARRSLVLSALMAGALTKFVPVLLIPVAAAAIWRDRLALRRERRPVEEEEDRDQPRHEESANGARLLTRQSPVLLGRFDAFSAVAVGLALAAALAVLLYAPFWSGPSSIGALGRNSLFTASIPRVALDVLIEDVGMKSDQQVGAAQAIVRNTAFALTALVTLGLTLWVFRTPNATTPEGRQQLVGRALRAFYEIIFFYLAFATLWFQPWYLIWLIALTAPVARTTYAYRTILFCIGGVANYFVWDFIWLWNQTGQRNIQVTAALAIYILPLFFSFYIVLKQLTRRGDYAQYGA